MPTEFTDTQRQLGLEDTRFQQLLAKFQGLTQETAPGERAERLRAFLKQEQDIISSEKSAQQKLTSQTNISSLIAQIPLMPDELTYNTKVADFIATVSGIVAEQLQSNCQSLYSGTGGVSASIDRGNIKDFVAVVEIYCDQVIKQNYVTTTLESMELVKNRSSYGGIVKITTLGLVDRLGVERKAASIKAHTMIYAAEFYASLLHAVDYSTDLETFDRGKFNQKTTLEYFNKKLDYTNPYLQRYIDYAKQIAESKHLPLDVRLHYYTMLMKIELSKNAEDGLWETYLESIVKLLHKELKKETGLYDMGDGQRIGPADIKVISTFKSLLQDYYSQYWDPAHTETILKKICNAFQVNKQEIDDNPTVPYQAIAAKIKEDLPPVTSNASDGSQASNDPGALESIRSLLEGWQAGQSIDRDTISKVIAEVFSARPQGGRSTVGSLFSDWQSYICGGDGRRVEVLKVLVNDGLYSLANYNSLMSISVDHMSRFKRNIKALSEKGLLSQDRLELLFNNSDQVTQVTDQIIALDQTLEDKLKGTQTEPEPQTLSMLVTSFSKLSREIDRQLREFNSEELSTEHTVTMRNLLNLIFRHIPNSEGIDISKADINFKEPQKDILTALITAKTLIEARADRTTDDVVAQFKLIQQQVYLNAFMTKVLDNLEGRTSSSRKFVILRDLQRYYAEHASEMDAGDERNLLLQFIQATLVHRHKTKDRTTTSAEAMIQLLKSDEFAFVRDYLRLDEVSQDSLVELLQELPKDMRLFDTGVDNPVSSGALYHFWQMGRGSAKKVPDNVIPDKIHVTHGPGGGER